MRPNAYRRRLFHRTHRHIGLPLPLDSRNRNRYRPSCSPYWITLGCIAVPWFLIWVIVRAAIQ